MNNIRLLDYQKSDAVANELRKAASDPDVGLNPHAIHGLSISTADNYWTINASGQAVPRSGESVRSLIEHLKSMDALSWAFLPQPDNKSEKHRSELEGLSAYELLEFANRNPPPKKRQK